MPTGQYSRKPMSKETKRKIALKASQRKQSPQTRAKLSILRSGPANPRWKGNKAKRITLHKWIHKHKPKPKCCEDCGKEAKLAAANIKDHRYTRNIEDYKWLCYSCHQRLDRKRKVCKRGHKLEGSNLIILRNGWNGCKRCSLAGKELCE